MLRIELASGRAFVGRQIFTNDAGYPVAGVREGDQFSMYGAGQEWALRRVDH
jgi:hypothetical protein